MAFNETLNDRIREALAQLPHVEEKRMFGGSCFMVNGKMCVGVIGDDMMCRVGPDAYEALVHEQGARPMDFQTRPIKGYLYVDAAGYSSQRDLRKWIDRCLAFNPLAPLSRKKR